MYTDWLPLKPCSVHRLSSSETLQCTQTDQTSVSLDSLVFDGGACWGGSTFDGGLNKFSKIDLISGFEWKNGVFYGVFDPVLRYYRFL